MEDVRQSAAHPVRAGCPRRAVGGLDAASSGRAGLDRLRLADCRAADDPAGDRRTCAAAFRHHGAQPFHRAWGGCSCCPRAVRAARGLSRSPGLADAGCDRLDLVSAFRQPSPSARLDHRGPVQEHASRRLDRLRQTDGGKPLHCVAGRAVRLVCRQRGKGGCRALRPRLAVGARDRALGERGASRCRPPGGYRRRYEIAPADRPPHLAFLRDLRHRGRPHVASGQLPGGSGSRRRSPDVPDQSWSSAPVDDRSPRLRLDRHARGRRAARGDACDHGVLEALPRPLLQLV